MSHVLKIAIIGDFNFTYNAHHATNLALDHAGRFLEIEVNYYWIKLAEATQFKSNQLQEYDGIWISPGPYKNIFFLSGIIDQVLQSKLPTFITGEGFKSLIEVLINRFNLNPNGEKLISDNLVEGEQFERIEIVPNSDALIKIYENHSPVELTSSRYSLYPQLMHYLLDELIDIEGYNQFEEAEIISLKKYPFFVACGFCPQISSTREIPHPLVYTFMKACVEKQKLQSNN
jgi:CTP synthase (UTP-ammonia lyase)